MKPDDRSDEEQVRLDRQLGELLQELRIAMPGVQLLFAFLLAVPFQQRFGATTNLQRDIYLLTLLSATVSSALLIAPAAYHRLLFGRGDKPRVIRFAERASIAGLVFLALSMSGAVALVTSSLFDVTTAVVATAAVVVMFSWLWFGLAVLGRHDHQPPDGGVGHRPRGDARSPREGGHPDRPRATDAHPDRSDSRPTRRNDSELRPDPSDRSASRSDATPTRRAERASTLAREIHDGQTDRYGRPMIEHVQRVAAVVSDAERPLALVHDICERSSLSPVDVADLLGLDDDEGDGLALLTKHEGESLLDHTRRVTGSPAGRARDLALAVKRADLADHTAHTTDADPPYVEAIALVDVAQRGAGG